MMPFAQLQRGCLPALVVILTLSVVSCGSDLGRGVLLKWKQGDTKVTLEDHASFDSTLELHINKAGRQRTEYVIDKSDYATLRFIWYQDKLWVANDRFLFVRYDPATDSVASYHDLPFTLWENQGKVLSEYRFSDSLAKMRSDFQLKKESTPYAKSQGAGRRGD